MGSRTSQLAQYTDIRPNIRECDLLLFRDSRDPVSRLISLFTRSPYHHVGMVMRLGQRLYIYEALATGVRPMLLSRRIATSSARIDLHRVPLSSAHRIKERALTYAAHGYDFGGIVRFVYGMIRGIPASGDDRRLFCSELIARAYDDALEIGWNPSFVSPADIARHSNFQFTIHQRG